MDPRLLQTLVWRVGVVYRSFYAKELLHAPHAVTLMILTGSHLIWFKKELEQIQISERNCFLRIN